jgi:hypothetical protein
VTQDQRIATIVDRLKTSASNLRFARALAGHVRPLRKQEVELLSDLSLEVIRELGALVQELNLGLLPDGSAEDDSDQECP